jgi:hypothetical protein
VLIDGATELTLGFVSGGGVLRIATSNPTDDESRSALREEEPNREPCEVPVSKYRNTTRPLPITFTFVTCESEMRSRPD